MPTTVVKQRRKVKKSFSISPESVLFIRKMRKERKARSESETLDGLLNELIAIQQQRGIEAAYSSYYDSLSDEEIAEDRAWGTFAEMQLINGVR